MPRDMTMTFNKNNVSKLNKIAKTVTNWKPPGDKGQDDDSLIEWVLSLTRNRRRRFIFTHPFFSLLLSDSNVSWQTFIQASFRVKSDAKKKLGSDVPKIFYPSLIMYYIYICTKYLPGLPGSIPTCEFTFFQTRI